VPRAPVARTGILLTCGKYLHGSIISCREEVWAHKNSITYSYRMLCPDIQNTIGINKIKPGETHKITIRIDKYIWDT
jgi:hypothetical protein